MVPALLSYVNENLRTILRHCKLTLKFDRCYICHIEWKPFQVSFQADSAGETSEVAVESGFKAVYKKTQEITCIIQKHDKN